MSDFKSEFIDRKQDILIPALQRDYVQGGDESVINPFVEELASALRGDKTVMLNYIYGYEKNNSFVPIDGQQRLVTLWLLHLCHYIKRGESTEGFPALRFESREFADDFCRELKNSASALNSGDVFGSTKIKAQTWFIDGWMEDATVANILKALDVICGKIKDEGGDCHFDRIQFEFLDVESKGLTDDIYVKMNGRGRPLTYFENLKNLMDDSLTRNEKIEAYVKADWQIKIDNKWADLFWRNRIVDGDVDDMQIRLFYSLLYLYWCQKDVICGDGKNSDKEEKERVLKKLFACKEYLSMYDIEHYGLLDEDALKFIYDSMEKLCEMEKWVNGYDGGKAYFDLQKQNDKGSLVHSIALDEATYVKTLPYLYMLVKCPYAEDENNFRRWVRIFRNLILNTQIDGDNIKKVLEAMNKIAGEAKDMDFYQMFVRLDWNDVGGFGEDQFDEEKRKIKFMDKCGKENVEDAEIEIIRCEKNEYLQGNISALFPNDNPDNIGFALEYLKGRHKLLEDMLNNKDDKDGYHFVKVLLSKLSEDRVNKWPVDKWVYFGKNSWKSLITKHFKGEFRMVTEDKVEISKTDWINLLTDSSLGILGKVSDGEMWFRKYRNEFWLYFGSRIDNSRNICLSNLQSKYEILFRRDEIKIDDKDSYWFYADVHFAYGGKRFFWCDYHNNLYRIDDDGTFGCNYCNYRDWQKKHSGCSENDIISAKQALEFLDDNSR